LLFTWRKAAKDAILAAETFFMVFSFFTIYGEVLNTVFKLA
jgi:hypothetical protein